VHSASRRSVWRGAIQIDIDVNIKTEREAVFLYRHNFYSCYASAAYAATEAFFTLSVPVSVPCRRHLFRFARTLNGFRWNSRDIIITTNRLNGYILSKPEQGRGAGYDRIFESTPVSAVAVMLNSCWRLANECTDFTGTQDSRYISKQFRINLKIARYFKDFAYEININILRILQHFFQLIKLLYTICQQPTQTSSFVCSFIAPFLLALVRKHLQRMSDKCSGGGIIWPRSVFSSLDNTIFTTPACQ